MNQLKLQQQLTLDEGKKLRVYPDTKGKLTVGIGHNLTDKGISEAVCAQMFDEDVADALVEVAKLWPDWSTLDDVRQRVLLDLAFNLEHKLEEFHDFWAAVKRRDWPAAASALEDSLWWKQVGARGPRLRHMLLTGTDVPELDLST